MKKRFTDANKWSDPWFQELPAKYKFFWMYVCDKCDHAGIYTFSRKQVVFDIEFEPDINEISSLFEGRIRFINSEKWHIVKFFKFQYGELNSRNNVQRSALKILKDNDIEINSCSTVGQELGNSCSTVGQELGKGCQALQEQDQVQEKESVIFKSVEISDKDHIVSAHPEILSPEYQLFSQACKIFGESPEELGMTDGRAKILRLIRGDRRIGGDKLIRACENRARDPGAFGALSVTFFIDDDFKWAEKITKWAQGVRYGTGSIKNTSGIRSTDIGDDAPIPVRSCSG